MVWWCVRTTGLWWLWHRVNHSLLPIALAAFENDSMADELLWLWRRIDASSPWAVESSNRDRHKLPIASPPFYDDWMAELSLPLHWPWIIHETVSLTAAVFDRNLWLTVDWSLIVPWTNLYISIYSYILTYITSIHHMHFYIYIYIFINVIEGPLLDAVSELAKCPSQSIVRYSLLWLRKFPDMILLIFVYLHTVCIYMMCIYTVYVHSSLEYDFAAYEFTHISLHGRLAPVFEVPVLWEWLFQRVFAVMHVRVAHKQKGMYLLQWLIQDWFSAGVYT